MNRSGVRRIRQQTRVTGDPRLQDQNKRVTFERGLHPVPALFRLAVIDELNPSRKAYELGIGWGTLAIPIARRYRDPQIVGYENSPVPFVFSRIRAAVSPHRDLHIERANFLNIDLTDATYSSAISRPRP